MKILDKYIDEFQTGRDLCGGDAEALLDAMIASEDEDALARLFRAWDAKEIASDEIFYLASILRSRCTPVRSSHERTIDIVGTGGSSSKTFNVSTAAAFVAAGASVPVAKHGNRAATSNSGSADVLGELGVNYAVDAATAERTLNEVGICFMFAPNFHRLSPTLGKVRRGLGFPTIFNCVGPLCNPASAEHGLIGVWSSDLVEKMATALARLGTHKSWIVHGCGLDELSISGTTLVAEVTCEGIKRFEVLPDDHGIETRKSDDIRVSTPAASAELIRSVLAGTNAGSAAEAIVLLNAGAALYLSGRAENVNEGIELAAATIRCGAAMRKLNDLAEAVRTE